MFRDRFGKVIYVGKARDLRRRLGNYFQPSRRHTADAKLRSLINSISDWSYTIVRTEDEALLLESQLIKSYAPHYNILMRDDKRYLLLKVDLSEKFPTLSLARLKKPDHARYFGPFPHGTALKMTREFLLSYFGLRGCKNPDPDEETRKHCLKKLVKMHTLKAQLKSKEKKRGHALRKMSMLRAYANRLKPTPTDTTLP